MLKFGHDVEFFRLLEKQAAVAQRAAAAFLEFTQDFTNLPAKAEALKAIEHEGDDLTRTLQSKILSTFITPLDKEDLKALSQALDDVTDAVEAAANRATLYKLTGPARPELAMMAQVIVKMTDLSASAVGELHKNVHGSGALDTRVEDIHRLENEGDALHRQALVALFDEPGLDTLTVIKWKEIFELTEEAVDVAENVADALGDIMIKYA